MFIELISHVQFYLAKKKQERALARTETESDVPHTLDSQCLLCSLSWIVQTHWAPRTMYAAFVAGFIGTVH